MMGHKICLFGEIWKIISELYLLLLLIWSSVKYSECVANYMYHDISYISGCQGCLTLSITSFFSEPQDCIWKIRDFMASSCFIFFCVFFFLNLF